MIEIEGLKFRIFADKRTGIARIKQYIEKPANMFFPWVGTTRNWYWVCTSQYSHADIAEFDNVELAQAWLQLQHKPDWVEIDYE